MKNTIKLLIVGGSILLLSGCAGKYNIFTHKEVEPRVVTVDEIVKQYDLPQVNVIHNGTRYVNIKTREYAQGIVYEKQADENAIAANKTKIYYINNKLADSNLFKK